MIWLLILALSAGAFGADFIARLDRIKVAEGDPVVLTLSASGNTSGAPDLTPLQAHFDLLNRAQSTHMRFVNGRSFSGVEWRLTLMPKRAGTIEIPAITFGDKSSEPLTLEVLPAAQADQLGTPRPVMIEVDTEPKQPYVQQKLIHTVRVLFSAPLRDVNLSEPQASGALLRPLGEGGQFETYRNGVQYRAIERRYAVFPQRSGALEIAGPVLDARMALPGQQSQRGGSLRDRFFGNDVLNGLGQTRPVRITAPSTSVDVRPQPAGTPSPWLPAESLTLDESWSPGPQAFRVGEPVTRTVVIKAKGLSDAQLPDLAIVAPAGINAYPERPTMQTRPDKATLIAQKVIRTALVPTRPGDLTLPEISVAWWDVAADKAAVARLPARRVQVQAAASGSAAVPSPPDSAVAASGPPDAAAASAQTRDAGNGTAADDVMSGGWPYWPWLTAALAVALALALAALWRRSRLAGPQAGSGGEPAMPTLAKAPDPTAALVTVERAFHANDAKTARRALLAWAEQRWPQDPPLRLDCVAERLGAEAAEVFRELDGALYADSAAAGSWDGEAAWRRLKPHVKSIGRSDNSHDGSALPQLYAGSN